MTEEIKDFVRPGVSETGSDTRLSDEGRNHPWLVEISLGQFTTTPLVQRFFYGSLDACEPTFAAARDAIAAQSARANDRPRELEIVDLVGKAVLSADDIRSVRVVNLRDLTDRGNEEYRIALAIAKASPAAGSLQKPAQGNSGTNPDLPLPLEGSAQ